MAETDKRERKREREGERLHGTGVVESGKQVMKKKRKTRKCKMRRTRAIQMAVPDLN